MTEKDRIHQGFLIKATGPEKGNWQESGEQRRRAGDGQLEPISGVVINNPDTNKVIVPDSGSIRQESSDDRARAALNQLKPVGPVAPTRKELLEPPTPIEHLRAVLGRTDNSSS